MKKLISTLLVLALTASFAVNASATTKSKYSDLDWYYPCPGEYGVYFIYNPPSHYGLDISAPNDSDICSVDNGKVKFSGYHKSTGYYVVVSNNTRLSGVTNPLYTRYLHMDYSPDVAYNEDVDRGQRVGGVGSDGDYVSSRQDHLHFDVNTGKYTGGSSFSSSNTIDPELFWPDADFSYLNNRAVPHGMQQIEPPIAIDEFIDTNLIRFVGESEFDQWMKANNGQVTLDSFKVRFGISDARFAQLVQQFSLQEVYFGNF